MNTIKQKGPRNPGGHPLWSAEAKRALREYLEGHGGRLKFPEVIEGILGRSGQLFTRYAVSQQARRMRRSAPPGTPWARNFTLTKEHRQEILELIEKYGGSHSSKEVAALCAERGIQITPSRIRHIGLGRFEKPRKVKRPPVRRVFRFKARHDRFLVSLLRAENVTTTAVHESFKREFRCDLSYDAIRRHVERIKRAEAAKITPGAELPDWLKPKLISKDNAKKIRELAESLRLTMTRGEFVRYLDSKGIVTTGVQVSNIVKAPFKSPKECYSDSVRRFVGEFLRANPGKTLEQIRMATSTHFKTSFRRFPFEDLIRDVRREARESGFIPAPGESDWTNGRSFHRGLHYPWPEEVRRIVIKAFEETPYATATEIHRRCKERLPKICVGRFIAQCRRFKAEILGRAKPGDSVPVWLETAGLHPEDLRRVIELADRYRKTLTAAKFCELVKARGYNISESSLVRVYRRSFSKTVKEIPVELLLPPERIEWLQRLSAERSRDYSPEQILKLLKFFGFSLTVDQLRGIPGVQFSGRGDQFPCELVYPAAGSLPRYLELYGRSYTDEEFCAAIPGVTRELIGYLRLELGVTLEPDTRKRDSMRALKPWHLVSHNLQAAQRVKRLCPLGTP